MRLVTFEPRSRRLEPRENVSVFAISVQIDSDRLLTSLIRGWEDKRAISESQLVEQPLKAPKRADFHLKSSPISGILRIYCIEGLSFHCRLFDSPHMQHFGHCEGDGTPGEKRQSHRQMLSN